jgi:hypothetical protein
MKRLLAISCVILLLGAGLFLMLRRSEPAPVAPVMVISLPYKIPRQKVSLFDRWVPRRASWSWLWRFKETVLGRPKVCDLRATVVDFAGSGESFLTSHPLPPPAFADANGLKIWLLSQSEINSLNRDLRQVSGPEILYMPGITTADGMQAQLTSGNTIPIRGSPVTVGLSIDLLSRLRLNGADVTTIITLTEAITNQASGAAEAPATGALDVQTDFKVASRMQVPKGFGAFLLQGPPAATRVGAHP